MKTHMISKISEKTMPAITVKKINRLYVAFKQERQSPDSVVFGPRGQVQFYANGKILPTEQYSVSYRKEIAIGQLNLAK